MIFTHLICDYNKHLNGTTALDPATEGFAKCYLGPVIQPINLGMDKL
jgi:hypothetical protein